MPGSTLCPGCYQARAVGIDRARHRRRNQSAIVLGTLSIGADLEHGGVMIGGKMLPWPIRLSPERAEVVANELLRMARVVQSQKEASL